MGDLDDIARDGPVWFRYLVLAALLSGAGSGVVGLTKDTTDRYKGSDAKADFAERDAEIRDLQRQQNAHLQHSAVYSERIDRIGIRLAEVERQLHSLIDNRKDAE